MFLRTSQRLVVIFMDQPYSKGLHQKDLYQWVARRKPLINKEIFVKSVKCGGDGNAFQQQWLTIWSGLMGKWVLHGTDWSWIKTCSSLPKKLKMGRNFDFHKNNDHQWMLSAKAFKMKKIDVVEWPYKSPNLMAIELQGQELLTLLTWSNFIKRTGSKIFSSNCAKLF